MIHSASKPSPVTRVIGRIPYRLALAGGWIDQPFVSRHNPKPPSQPAPSGGGAFAEAFARAKKK